MKKLYSYKGQEPRELPERIFLTPDQTESGLRETRTSLCECCVEELQSYGFTGPYEMPIYDQYVEKVIWDGTAYHVIPLNDEELEEVRVNQRNLKRQILNYEFFANEIKNTIFYEKVVEESKTKLFLNKILSDFNSLLENIENEYQAIQDCIVKFFITCSFTDLEIESLKHILFFTHLDLVYELPDSYYLSLISYDEQNDEIIQPQGLDPDLTIINQ